MSDKYDVLLRGFADLSGVKLCQQPAEVKAEHGLAATVLYCIRPDGHPGLHRALIEWCDHLGQADSSSELSAHQEAAILDTLPDEVLERLPGHDGPGHAEDGPADCRRCALLRQHGPALEEAARILREKEGL